MSALAKSQAWLDQHKATIGSSIAAAVIGEHPCMTIQDAYDYMIGEAAPAEFNQDMERGVLLEPIARRKLAETLKTKIEPHPDGEFLYSTKYPHAHALPDGWITVVGDVPVELKVPRPQNWQKMKLNGMHGYWFVQCAHQLAVTGAPWLEFGALNPVTMEVLSLKVERDEAFIALLMEREAEFFKAVQARQRPIAEPVKLDIPEQAGELTKIDTPEALDAARAYIEADQLSKDAEQLREDAKLKLLGYMDLADAVEFPGLRCYYRQQTGRVTFNKKAMAKDHPGIDLTKYETQGKPFHVFKAYRLGR